MVHVTTKRMKVPEAPMGVRVIFECGGCDAVAQSADRLKREFRSITGRSYGIGGPIEANTVEDITPAGWVAFDPYTYCTYCPKCAQEIWPDDDQKDDEVQRDG